MDDRRPDDDEVDAGETVELPVDGMLDLHTFHPRDVRSVVIAYLDEAYTRGIGEVRIVHGKGTGTQRRIVEGVLARHPKVLSFRPAEGDRGGWGATVATLRRPEESPACGG